MSSEEPYPPLVETPYTPPNHIPPSPVPPLLLPSDEIKLRGLETAILIYRILGYHMLKFHLRVRLQAHPSEEISTVHNEGIMFQLANSSVPSENAGIGRTSAISFD